MRLLDVNASHTKQGYLIADCYPAEFEIAHATIQKNVCFTATYVDQAVTGEKIEVCGQLEQDEFGNQRIVIDSSREARGEYCLVCDYQPPT